MNSEHTLEEIARHVGGDLDGDGGQRISGAASLRSAGPGDISYVESRKYLRDLGASRASAVIMAPQGEAPEGMAVVRVAQPTVAWAKVVELLCPYRRRFTEVSADAWIGADVEIGDGVGIAPGVHIGDRVRIGAGTEIYPGVTIGDGSSVGVDCRLHAGVHVYHDCTVGDRVVLHSGVIIGADGYGFAQEKLDDPESPVRHRKVPQVGGVVIEDDVEIGANSTVDRGALDATVIGRGTKIDNLVMVAHNCRVGPHCLLVGQMGLSGSVEVGPYVTIAGQAGVAGHLKIGARAIIGAKAGVMRHVEDGEILLGSPAYPAGVARRAYAQIEHLPQFRKDIQTLQKKVEELEARLEGRPD